MKNMFKFLFLPVLFSLCFMTLGFAEEGSIVGKWKTIDDKTGEPKAIVEIYEQDGKYFGKIKEIFLKPGDNPDPICDKCPDKDPRKNQPKKGMVILKDLVKKGDKYSDGTILDTSDGKIYTCKLWIEKGDLKLRGYIAFFYRTQTWLKVE